MVGEPIRQLGNKTGLWHNCAVQFGRNSGSKLGAILLPSPFPPDMGRLAILGTVVCHN